MDIRPFDENSPNKEEKQPKTFKHIGQNLGPSSIYLKFMHLKLPKVSEEISLPVEPKKNMMRIKIKRVCHQLI